VNELSVFRKRSIDGYNRLSGIYRWIERVAFGGALMRTRKSLVKDLEKAERVLVLGDGDGRLLVEILRSQPAAKITSMDQSPKMLAQQRRRVHSIGAEDRVEFVEADVMGDEAANVYGSTEAGRFDLLIVAFVLDCFDQDSLAHLMPMLLDSIADEGQFYYVDFTEPDEKLPRMHAKFMLAIMHWFFAWQTGLRTRSLVDVPRMLDDWGWEVTRQSDHHFKMITARIYKRRPSSLS
jgi:ubiquinone/menaquinone biosynthesis C-methylase UbiE